MTIRSLIKGVLPRPVRTFLHVGLTYLQRLGNWVIVVRQVRGASWRDQLKLLASATAAPLTSLSDLNCWQDPILLFDIKVRIKGVGRFHIRRHSDDLWHVLPWRERALHQALKQILKPGDRFVDGGANIGVYTLLGSRLVGSRGQVIAIEMMPDTAAILRRHVSENGCGNVEIVERALSDRSNETVIARTPPRKYGQASIAKSEGSQQILENEEVRTITLDEACGGIEPIRLMKLDLEGAELQALAGGHSTLEKTEWVIFESHTASDALEELFENAGFDVVHFFGKDRLAQRRVRPS